MNIHEEKFINAFIRPEKRERYRWMLSKAKKRNYFLGRLAHNLDYIEKYATQIPNNMQSVSQITSLLKNKGAPENCHIISENSNIDGKDIALHQALEQVIGYSMGTILCCIPGKLAYYESEDLNCRYILEKKG